MSANASATAAAASATAATAAAGSAAVDKKGGADAAGAAAERKTNKDGSVVVAQDPFGDMDFELDEAQLVSYRKFMADYEASREALRVQEQKKSDELKKFMDEMVTYNELQIENVNTSEILPQRIKAMFVAIAEGRYNLARIILTIYLREKNGLREGDLKEEGDQKDNAEKEKDLQEKDKDKKEGKDEKPKVMNPLAFLVKLKGWKVRGLLGDDGNTTIVYFAVRRIFDYSSPKSEILEHIYLIMDLILAGCPVNTNLLGLDKNTALHWLTSNKDKQKESYDGNWLNLLMFVLFANKEPYNNEGLLTAPPSSDINIFDQSVDYAGRPEARTVLMELFREFPRGAAWGHGAGHYKFFQQAVFLLLYGENYDYFALPPDDGSPQKASEGLPKKVYDKLQEQQYYVVNEKKGSLEAAILATTTRFIHADMARACLVKLLGLPLWRYRQIPWTLREFYGPLYNRRVKKDPDSERRELKQRLAATETYSDGVYGNDPYFQSFIIEHALQIRNRGYFEGAYYKMELEGFIGSWFPFPVWMIVKEYQLRTFIPEFMRDGYDYAASVDTPRGISAERLGQLVPQTEIIDSPYEEVVAAISRSSNFRKSPDNAQFASIQKGVMAQKTSYVFPWPQDKKSTKKDRTCYRYHSAQILACPHIDYEPQRHYWRQQYPIDRYFSVERSDKYSDCTLVRFWDDGAATRPNSDGFLFVYRPDQNIQAQKSGTQKGGKPINASAEAKGLNEKFMLCVGMKSSRIADRFSPVLEEEATDRKNEDDQKRAGEAAAPAKPVVSTAKGNASKQPAAGASKQPETGVAAKKSGGTYFLFRAYLAKQTAQRNLDLARANGAPNAKASAAAPRKPTLQVDQIFGASASKQGGKLQLRF